MFIILANITRLIFSYIKISWGIFFYDMQTDYSAAGKALLNMQLCTEQVNKVYISAPSSVPCVCTARSRVWD